MRPNCYIRSALQKSTTLGTGIDSEAVEEVSVNLHLVITSESSMSRSTI